jgi:hypothetical protein
MATKHTDGCFRHAEDDEPLFTLLARDPLAPGLVRSWAALGAQTGQDAAKVEDALQVAEKMDRWREERRPHKASFFGPGGSLTGWVRDGEERIASLSTALAESREREARLAEAIQPVAAWAEKVLRVREDAGDPWMAADHLIYACNDTPLTAGHLRTLLAALAGSREGERP